MSKRKKMYDEKDLSIKTRQTIGWLPKNVFAKQKQSVPKSI